MNNPDFGYTSPTRTKNECSNPAFADHNLHRVGLFKDFHIGSRGDIDENGLPGWVAKFVCVQCGKKMNRSAFFIDNNTDKNY